MAESPWITQMNLVIFYFRHFICMSVYNPIRELLTGHVKAARTDEHWFACAELVPEAVE